MEQKQLQGLYKKAFHGVDNGFSYEQMSYLTGIPEKLIRIEHIKESRKSGDYQQQIQHYALELIKKHGLKILSVSQINQLIRTIPYRFRYPVKHLIHNLKEQVNKRKLDALSRINN